ncbi:hypothetical protein [Amycolatopsis vancoresmycina]|uniref:hypothetical protein n=1 Tax=Amycolatopsis vancoresmycina TaxID=208444 RepID=UPI00052433B6|nr:hypothetical protein [Amycolatopsis vancoresmycina]
MYRTVLARTAYQDAFFAWPRADRERYVALLRSADPTWAPDFLSWLRTETPMRYPALVGAAAFVAGRRERGEHGLSRQVIAAVLRRADDPGHLLAYWGSAYGPSLPKPVKRGVAEAVTCLYDEQALLAYDNASHHFELGFVRADLPWHGGIGTPRPLRFGTVIRLVHPRARDREQGDLFRYALARRYGRVRTIPATLPLARSWAGLPAAVGGVGGEPPGPVGRGSAVSPGEQAMAELPGGSVSRGSAAGGQRQPAAEPAAGRPAPAGSPRRGEPPSNLPLPPGPLHLTAALRSVAGHPPPGQWLAQLRRARTGDHAGTVLATLPLADLLARPGGLARLEPLIPHLPLSTLLAHLRRFDAAGIGFETAMAVAARIADPGEVRASGLGPLRFAAAWGRADSRRWEPALAAGARHSLEAVPRLRGRTLVVVEPGCDTRIVFGIALAQRCDDADVVLLGGGRFALRPGESPLHALIRWHSTDLRAAAPVTPGHDRVVLLTEQYLGEPPGTGVPHYVWETRRHRRHEHEPEFAPGSGCGFFRGLGDASFRIIPWWEEFVGHDQ